MRKLFQQSRERFLHREAERGPIGFQRKSQKIIERHVFSSIVVLGGEVQKILKDFSTTRVLVLIFWIDLAIGEHGLTSANTSNDTDSCISPVYGECPTKFPNIFNKMVPLFSFSGPLCQAVFHYKNEIARKFYIGDFTY